MKITEYLSDQELLTELGTRLKDIRIAAPMTQKELSQRSGVSSVTISAMENGKEVSLISLISVMRVLGLISNFDVLIPEQTVRPSQIVQLGKKRERASSKRSVPETGNSWKWGDDE